MPRVGFSDDDDEDASRSLIAGEVSDLEQQEGSPSRDDDVEEEWSDSSVARWIPLRRDVFPIQPFRKTFDRELNDARYVKEDMQRSSGRALCTVALKWFLPMLFVGFFTFVSMVLLHIGTYFYVHHMDMMTKLFKRVEGQSPNQFNVTLTMGWASGGQLLDGSGRPMSLSYGSLNDEGHALLGYSSISLQTLDFVALVFPVSFVFLAVLMDELGVWTKVMISNAALALLKGVLGVLTTIPDSQGWHECKERLGPEGLRWMVGIHSSLLDFLRLELVGVDGVRLRWCADMMFSGHTYFTTLYALGTYELSVSFTREWPPCWRRILLLPMLFLAVGEQSLEIYLVLLNRFHYSMDVVVAIVMTFLIFSNGWVAQLAKHWVWFGIERRKHEWSPAMVKKVFETRQGLEKKMRKLSRRESRDDCVFRDPRVTIFPSKEVSSNADVFIPPCMMPLCFCCCFRSPESKDCYLYGVRQHVFDDHDLGDMLFAGTMEQQKHMCIHMNLSMRHTVRSNKHFRKLYSIKDKGESWTKRKFCYL